MKREFLLNFKVGDQPLPKEIVDAIMDENGRDVEAAKAPFADYETIKTQLEEARTTLQGVQRFILNDLLPKENNNTVSTQSPCTTQSNQHLDDSQAQKTTN